MSFMYSPISKGDNGTEGNRLPDGDFSMMIVQALQRKEIPSALSGKKSTRLLPAAII
jgi:hypothetical protein